MEELVLYAHGIRRAEGISKLLLDESRESNGLMDIETFLSHLSYLEVGIKNPNDHRLLLEKYDTFKDDQMNLTEFCYDFETIFKDIHPEARVTLNKVTSKIESLVTSLGEKIASTEGSVFDWVEGLKTKELKSKIPLNVLLVRLKEVMPSLRQDELISLLQQIDRRKKGFVLDFQLTQFFTSFQDEGCHPVVAKLMNSMKQQKSTLPAALKSALDSTGSVQYKKLEAILESVCKISEQETRSLMIFLGMKSDKISLAELQAKIRQHLLSYDTFSRKQIDLYITGRGSVCDEIDGAETAAELSNLKGIAEKLVKALNIKQMSFEEMFGDGKTIKSKAFQLRMQDLGLTSHVRYSELIETLKVPKVFETLDLTKLKGFLENLSSDDKKEAVDYQNAKELI